VVAGRWYEEGLEAGLFPTEEVDLCVVAGRWYEEGLEAGLFPEAEVDLAVVVVRCTAEEFGLVRSVDTFADPRPVPVPLFIVLVLSAGCAVVLLSVVKFELPVPACVLVVRPVFVRVYRASPSLLCSGCE